MSTEMAVAHVSFSSNYGEVIKQTKQLAKQTEKSHKKMRKEIKKTTKEAEKMGDALGSAGKSVSESFGGASKVAKGFSAVFTGVTKLLGVGVKLFEKLGGVIGKGFSMAVEGATKIVGGWLEILGKVPKAINTVLETILKLPLTVGKYLNELTKIFVFLQLDIRYILDQFKMAAIGATVAIGGTTAALAHFEDAFVKVRKVTDMTTKEYNQMREELALLAQEVDKGATALSELAAVGGQLGISGVQNLRQFTETMAKLQMATNVAGEEGAAQFARLMTIMGVAQDKMKAMGSSLTALGNNFAAFENEILNMTFKIAGAGKAIGLTMQEVFALSTALSAAGVRAERGGSAVSRIMLEMANAAAEGGKVLETFADLMGLTNEQMAKMIENRPIQAIKMFISSLRELNESGGNVFSMLESLNVGQIRTRDVILRLVAAEDLLSGTVQTANDAWREQNALQEEVTKKMSTIWTQIKQLKNQVIGFARSIGRLYEDNVRAVITTLRLFVRALSQLDEEQLKVIHDLVKLIGVISSIGTAVLLATKAFFTFMTGVTLLGRLVTTLTPILFLMWVFKEVMEGMGKDPVEALVGGFKDLKSVIKGSKKALVELKNWFETNQTIQNIQEDFEQLANDIQQIRNQEDVKISVKIAQSAAEVTEFFADAVAELNRGIEKAVQHLKETEQPLQEGSELGSAFSKMFDNIGKLFWETMKLVFWELPKLLYTAFETSDTFKRIGQSLEEAFNDAWDDFTSYSQENMPQWTKTVNELTKTINDLKSDEKGGSILPDLGKWGKQVGSLYDQLFASPEDKKQFQQSVKGLLQAISTTVADFFGDILTEVLTQIDWQTVFTEMWAGLKNALFSWIQSDRQQDQDLPLINRQQVAEDSRDFVNQTPDWLKEFLGISYNQDWLQEIFESPWKNLNKAFNPSEWSEGGILPGYGGGDTIPALLERGEAVIPKDVVKGGMGAIAEWFKSQGAKGYQEGTTGSFLQQMANVSPFNMTLVKNLFDSVKDFTDKLIDNMDKLTNKIVGIITTLIQTLFSVARVVAPERYQETLKQMEQWAIGQIESIIGFDLTDFFAQLFGGGEEEPEKGGRPRPTEGLISMRRGGAPPLETLTPWQKLVEDMTNIWDFAKTRFEDLIDLFPTMKKNMINVFDNIEQWFQKPLEVKLFDIRNAFASAFYAVKDTVVGSLKTLGGMILQNANELQGLVQAAGAASGMGEEKRAESPMQAFMKGLSKNPLQAFFNMLMSLIQRSKTFQKILSVVNKVVLTLANVLGQMLKPLIPLVKTIGEALLPVIQLFAQIFGAVLTPIIKAITPIIKTVGQVLLTVAKVLGKAWNTLMDIISVLPFVDMSNWKIDVSKLTTDFDDLDNSVNEFKETTDKAADAMRNVPEGVKASLRAFQVADPTKTRDAIPSAASGGMVMRTGVAKVHRGEEIGQPSGDIHVHLENSTIYGVDDLDRRIRQSVDKAQRSNGLGRRGLSQAGGR